MSEHSARLDAYPLPQRANITGVLLAGGLSRRMSAEGRSVDKGLRLLDDQPLAWHVIRRIQPQVGALMINANRNLDAWRAFGLPVFEDRIDGFAGPLAGLDAAMARIRTPWIMTVPCDTPALPDDLVERLAQAATSTCAEVAVARTGTQAQPVFSLVRSSLHAHLSEFLATGRRRIDAWYAPLRVTEVDFSDPLAFRNLNTEQDLNDYLASRVAAPTAAPPIPGPHA